MLHLHIGVVTIEDEAPIGVVEVANEMKNPDHDPPHRYHDQGHTPAEDSIVHGNSKQILLLAAQGLDLAAQGGGLTSRRNQCVEPPGPQRRESSYATSS